MDGPRTPHQPRPERPGERRLTRGARRAGEPGGRGWIAHEIRPLTPDDLPELSRFLAEGFHATAGAAFAAVDVLAWKYFDPRGGDAGDAPRSYLARDPATGRVVGHLGVCPGRFHGGGLPAEGVSTFPMTDWLSARAGVGAALMQRAHQAADTQYGFGGSAAGRRAGGRGGYALVAAMPVYQNVLRLGYRLKVPGHGPTGRLLRAARDAAGMLARRAGRPRVPLGLRRVEAFGPEVGPALAAYATRAVFTSRGPDLLNHVLRYPRGGVTGWHLVRGGAVRGFAVLSLVPRDGGAREGRVVDCLLDDPDDDAWHAAVVALTGELRRQGADVATGFASTEWSARALRASGYAPAYAMEFRLRDPSNRLPRGASYHFTPLEADYATT